MRRIPDNPFTIIRGGLHPDATPTKPAKAKKEKFSPYQLQLIAQLKKKAIAQMNRHAERYWANRAAEAKQRDQLST